MVPVAVRAAFCVRESFSAGRAKSAMPAMTRAHWEDMLVSLSCPSNERLLPGEVVEKPPVVLVVWREL